MPDPTLELAEVDRPAVAPFAPGTALGNFRIVRELGAGGMGVVFEAHDPALDRRVAIKVVRDREAGPAAGARLMREAKALARLAHPNVVQVYDVDVIDGQVYVVMELVRGETLEAWLARPRGWREVVRVFVAAGDGLAAIHRAGLVHRDIKPSNVFVDDTGRARIGDLGIARDDHGGDHGDGAAGRPIGTPAYMAPEQRAGGAVDARADQYAFALALERALAGRPAAAPSTEPAAATTGATRATVAAGAIVPAAMPGRVPRAVRSAIARATNVDPSARFATIEQLVVELRRALDRSRRATVGISIGVAAIGVGVAVVAWTSRPVADGCDASAALVATVWSADARRTVAARFAEVRPGARLEPVAAVVDDWAGAWQLGRRTACRAEAARRGPQVACLDRGLAELRAQVAAFGRADGPAVDRALAAAMALPDPALCANQVAGASTPEAAALHARIAEVNAAQRAGQAGAVAPRLEGLVRDAGDDPALAALALYAAGFVELDLGDLAAARDHMVRAAREAGRARDDDTLLRALIAQASIAGELGRPEDALGVLDAADALVARAQLDRVDKLAMVRGDALTRAGRHPEAIAELSRAVAGYEREAAADPAARRDLAAALGALAGAYQLSFHYDEARALLVRAEAIETELLGPEHPEVAKTLHDLGVNAARLGRFDAAAAHHARARAILVGAYGERTLAVLTVDMSLALLALQRGDHDAAKQQYELLLTRMPDVLPPDHGYVATVEGALGSIERELDRCPAALPHFERAIAILERAGHAGMDLAVELTNLAGCYHELDRFPDARPPAERALAIHERARTPVAERAEAIVILADVEAAAGDRRRAIELATTVVDACADDARPALAPLCGYARDQLAGWTK